MKNRLGNYFLPINYNDEFSYNKLKHFIVFYIWILRAFKTLVQLIIDAGLPHT